MALRMTTLSLVLVILLTAGCTGVIPGTDESTSGTSTETEETTDMSAAADSKASDMELIRTASGCSEIRAENIWNMLSSLGTVGIASAEPAEGASDRSIEVVLQDGRTLVLGINRMGFLYSVKDTQSGKYLFTTYQ